MPSSSVGREVDLLLARLNDRSAAIVVEVSDDGGQSNCRCHAPTHVFVGDEFPILPPTRCSCATGHSDR